jgi:hypothetical protein
MAASKPQFLKKRNNNFQQRGETDVIALKGLLNQFFRGREFGSPTAPSARCVGSPLPGGRITSVSQCRARCDVHALRDCHR